MQLIEFAVMPLLAIALVPLTLLLGAPPRTDQPFLVVAAPWHDAESLVRAAGGRVLGPDRGVMAVVAAPLDSDRHGRFRDRLRQQGAWLVLDAGRLAKLCGV